MFQFSQFILVGMTNAAVDLGSLNLLLLFFPTRLHALLILYNTISYVLTIINSYLLNSTITFRKSSDRTIRQKLLYMVSVLICFLISNLVFLISLVCVEQLIEKAWLAQNIAKLLSMALSSLTSFLLMKYLVFRGKDAAEMR